MLGGQQMEVDWKERWVQRGEGGSLTAAAVLLLFSFHIFCDVELWVVGISILSAFQIPETIPVSLNYLLR